MSRTDELRSDKLNPYCIEALNYIIISPTGVMEIISAEILGVRRSSFGYSIMISGFLTIIGAWSEINRFTSFDIPKLSVSLKVG